MAVNIGSVNADINKYSQGQAQGQEAKHEGRTYNDVAGSAMFGFDNIPINGMNYADGLGSVKSVVEKLNEIFKDTTQDRRPKISVVDNTVIHGPLYSAIAIHKRYDNTVIFHVTLLENTGRRPQTVNEVVTEASNAMRTMSNNKPVDIWVTGDAINEVMLSYVTDAIKKEYNDSNLAFKYVDGMVVSPENFKDDIGTMAKHVASIAWRAIFTEASMSFGKLKDINIAEAMKRENNISLKISASSEVAGMVDELFRPVAASFMTELSMKNHSTSNKAHVLNVGAATTKLCRAYGIVDSIPLEKVNTDSGQPNGMHIRMVPHVIITGLQSLNNTLGWTMMNLAQAVAAKDPNIWATALANRVATKDKNRNVGVVNLMTDIGNTGNPIALNMLEKDVTPENVTDFIVKSYTGNPVFSLDVEDTGPQSFYTAVLSVASRMNGREGTRLAAEHIIAACSRFTNGRFPENYPIDRIFTQPGMRVPLGTYTDNKGTHDIRDIDYIYIANKTNDPALVNRTALLNDYNECIKAGINPYIERIKILEAIDANIVITGFATRVTFHPEFIATLVASAQAEGFVPEFDPRNYITRPSDIAHISGYLMMAGLGNSVPGYNMVSTGPTGSGMYNVPWMAVDSRYTGNVGY